MLFRHSKCFKGLHEKDLSVIKEETYKKNIKIHHYIKRHKFSRCRVSILRCSSLSLSIWKQSAFYMSTIAFLEDWTTANGRLMTSMEISRMNNVDLTPEKCEWAKWKNAPARRGENIRMRSVFAGARAYAAARRRHRKGNIHRIKSHIIFY